MTPKHISIAVEQGMKRGFESFASNSQLKGVSELIGGLSTRKAFAAYCGRYGDTVAELKGNGRNLSTPKAAKASTTKPVAAAMGELVSTTDGRTFLITDGIAVEVKGEVEEVGVEVTKPAKAKPAKADKPLLLETTFGAGTVKALGLPTTPGKAFTYKGKAGKSKWVVAEKNADGSIRANRR